MGDSSLITLLSIVPLLIITTSIAAAILAWRSRRRAVRIAIATLLIGVGATWVLSSIGVLFSMAGGVLIGVLGITLFIADYGAKKAA